jgi:hypothetical protein
MRSGGLPAVLRTRDPERAAVENYPCVPVIAVYALLARWIAVITAAPAVLSSSIFSTMLLGPAVWSAFLGSAHDSPGRRRFARFPSSESERQWQSEL